MAQQGRVLELKGRGADGRTVWAYRYRVGGRGSRRVQRGGFASEHAAAEVLAPTLERLRRARGLVEAPRLSELVGVYPAPAHGEAAV
jgi:predicted DNA-binding WGR domain protein